MMEGLMWTALVALSYAMGVCTGAASVEVVDDEPVLPSGWWLLPLTVVSALFWAALMVWVIA